MSQISFQQCGWLGGWRTFYAFWSGGVERERNSCYRLEWEETRVYLLPALHSPCFPILWATMAWTIVEHVLTHSLSSDENRCDWVKCDDDRKSFVLVNHFKILFLTWTGNRKSTIWGWIFCVLFIMKFNLSDKCCLCAAYKLDGDSCKIYDFE